MIRRLLPTTRDLLGFAILLGIVTATLAVTFLGTRAPIALGVLLLLALIAVASRLIGLELLDRRPTLDLEAPDPASAISARYCRRCANPATRWVAVEVSPRLFQPVAVCDDHADDV